MSPAIGMISMQPCRDLVYFMVDLIRFLPLVWCVFIMRGEISTLCIESDIKPCYCLIVSICNSSRIAYDSSSISHGVNFLLSKAVLDDDEVSWRLLRDVGVGYYEL